MAPGAHRIAAQGAETALTLLEARATAVLAWPLIAAALATIALTAVDTVMMGWLGPDQLAAGALGGGLIFSPMTFGFGLASATAPMIAQAIGARRFRDVRRTARQGLWLAIAVSALLIPPLQQGAALYALLGQAPEIGRLGETYLDWASLQLPFTIGFVVLRSFASAYGETRRSSPSRWAAWR
jgi:MATE family multidrug resistance protein